MPLVPELSVGGVALRARLERPDDYEDPQSEETWRTRFRARTELRPGPALELGDQVELASELCELIPGDCVFSEGGFWYYAKPRGIHVEISKSRLGSIVQWYSGVLVGAENAKRFRVSAQTVKGAIQCLQDRADAAHYFNDAPSATVFANHTVVAEGGEIERLDHSRDFRARYAYSFDFRPGAQPSRFLELLRESFVGCVDVEERIECIREYVGGCILGKATKFQKAIVLFGPGGTGKSVVLKIVEDMMPSGSVASIGPQRMGHEYSLATLAGKHLNVQPDISSADLFDSSAFKAVVTGDTVTGRFLYKDEFPFRPVAGHIYSANRLFGSRDHTTGLWRRLVPIEFGNVVSEERIDRNLAERVIKTELAELVSWAIEGGAKALHRGKLTVPLTSAKSLEDWRMDNDPVAMFVEQDYTCARLRTAPKRCWETLSDMHTAFGRFADEFKFSQMSRTTFKNRLADLGYRSEKTERGVCPPLVRKTEAERRASEVWSEATTVRPHQSSLEARYDD
ncbi:MAG: phage/plasmid primase, P4 family [Myxococcota bacterium]